MTAASASVRRCDDGTDEISGFPLYPWYPAALKKPVVDRVLAHRPDLVAYNPALAVHWFTHPELVAWLCERRCGRTRDVGRRRAAPAGGV